MHTEIGKTLNTFPKILKFRSENNSKNIAIREKYLGIWQQWTWNQVFNEVTYLACGLKEKGLSKGMNIAIVGENRPRLYWTISAAQSLGAVPVPIYQDSIASEMQYILQNADIQIAVVEDQEQVDKFLEVLNDDINLKCLIYDDPRGLENYKVEFLHDYEKIRQLGKKFHEANTNFFDDSINNTRPEDVSVILYTSGTTSKPKGVVHTHKSFLDIAIQDVLFDQFSEKDSVLSYLPMAWIGDHLFAHAQYLVAGYTLNCPESGETVINDMKEIGPTYYFAPPRVWENLLTQVMIRIEDASLLKRNLFKFFIKFAQSQGSKFDVNNKISLFNKILYFLGNILIYAPLKNVLGMSNLRIAYTGGAAIGPDLYKFYRSLGINLKQLYGQTETAAYVCKQETIGAEAEHVGKPLPGVEVKIADNKEILIKTPGIFKEYYKLPDEYSEAFDNNNFFKTGDAGFLDDMGNLKIIDRAKDVGTLLDNTLFAPQFLENKLKFFPYIKEAVCFGHKKDFVSCFINIDIDAVGNWAEKKGVGYSGYVDLSSKPEVAELVKDCISEVNEDLLKEKDLKGSVIKKFLVLPKELDADDDELTRTRKVRRNFINEKYKILIDALYSNVDNCDFETKVTFEDGRTGSLKANVKILDC